MKIKFKLSAIIFILILFTSVINYKVLTDTVEELLTKRLKSAEAILGQGIASTIYRLVIEEKKDIVTAIIFKELNLRHDKISYVVVKDREKQIFAHTFLTDIPREIYSLHNSFAAGENYYIDYLPDSDLDVFDISVPIREGIIQVGTLHIGINKNFIINTASPLKEASEKIVLLGVLCVVVGGALAYALSAAITGSLIKLTEVAHAISRGNYDERLNIESKDEVGALAASFELMVKNINKARRELESHNENLELLVSERTKSLEKSNKELLLSQEELKELNEDLAEQRKNLKIVFSAMDYPLYVVNKDYTIAMMNDTAKEMIATHQTKPYTCHALINHSSVPCSVQEHSCPLKVVFKEKKPVFIERVHEDSNGKKSFIEVRAYPIFDQDENVVQIVEACIDVTEQKKAVEENLRLERELHKAQKLESIGTLAAGIAHEINTPIQFIGDNTIFAKDSLIDVIEMIHDYRELFAKVEQENGISVMPIVEKINDEADYEYLAEELPKSLQQTLDGVAHVSKIVKAMKDFSHIGSIDEMKLEDLNHAIEITLTISKNEWKYHAEIQRDLSFDLPLVPCHIGEIKQVLLNLIVNAAHAIASRNEKENNKSLGTITVSSTIVGDEVKVGISDTGTGIPEEYRDKIFDHFFTTKEVSKGTGQGLSVAYQVIVEKHGGKIWFETELGVGTTFYFTLKSSS